MSPRVRRWVIPTALALLVLVVVIGALAGCTGSSAPRPTVPTAPAPTAPAPTAPAPTAPGTYELIAGPVPRSMPRDGLALSLPPDLREHFAISNNPLHGLSFVQRGDQTYIDAHLVVSAVTSPYDDLTAWFQ